MKNGRSGRRTSGNTRALRFAEAIKRKRERENARQQASIAEAPAQAPPQRGRDGSQSRAEFNRGKSSARGTNL
jgi:hypothetical protein